MSTRSDHENIRHLTIPGESVALHVAQAGEGPPVLLLHGFPENWRSWRNQIGPLVRAGFSVWAPDLRGYGRSEKPSRRRAYRIECLVNDVAAIVRATGSSRAHLVAHDWGGVIAWAFASRHPELVDRLVILNAPHMGVYAKKLFTTTQIFRSWYVLVFQSPVLPEIALSAFDFWILRRMFQRQKFQAEEIEAYVSALAQPGSLTAALNYYRANFFRALSSSQTIKAPTLVIWGEKDPYLGRELLDGLDHFVPQLQVHRIPGAGHWIQHEKADAVNRAIGTFLLGKVEASVETEKAGDSRG